VGSGKRFYDAAPDTDPPPPNEAVVARGVRTKCLGQITPGCSRAQDPEDAIEYASVVYPRNATWFVREHGSYGNPFMISEFVAMIRAPSFGKFESQGSGRSQRFRLSSGRSQTIPRKSVGRPKAPVAVL